MTRRILVQHGYTVPDRYITLEDCEELCKACHGTGKITIVYRDPGPNQQGDCFDCGGEGKRLHCIKCGRLEYHAMIKHDGHPELDGLCYSCLKVALGIREEESGT